MNVLQLASFGGNLGDSAHVAGLRRCLAERLGPDLVFHDLEIRQFYTSWNKARFDLAFAERVNEHDLLVIGGGGFFDMTIPESVTGTTLSLAPEVLDAIERPVVFYGLGCNQLRGPIPECVARFRPFLDRVLADDRYLVSVRNDGSCEVIGAYVGRDYAARVHEIPDPGFFFRIDDAHTGMFEEVLTGSRCLGVCLAGDEAAARYGDEQRFAGEMAGTLEMLLEADPGLRLVFFPHIYQDLEIIHRVVAHLPDPLRRQRVQVAPCFQGDRAAQFVFSLYRACDIVVSNRFHGLVVPIALGVPSVAFCDLATRKVPWVMDKLRLPDYKYVYHHELADLAGFVRDRTGGREAFAGRVGDMLTTLKRVNDEFLDRLCEML